MNFGNSLASMLAPAKHGRAKQRMSLEMNDLMKRVRPWTLVAWACVAAVACGGDEETDPNSVARDSALARGEAKDFASPTLSVVTPTTNESYSANAGSIAIAGKAQDNGRVARITWVSNQGNGVATVSTNASGTEATWSASDLALAEGENTITVRAYDAQGNRTSKRLYVSYTARPLTSETPEGTWTDAASEGQAFPVVGTQRVRFGADKAWVERSVNNSGDCSVSFFGSDPMVGARKVCQVLTAAAAVAVPVTTTSGTSTSVATASVSSPTTTSTCATTTSTTSSSSATTGTAPSCTSTASTPTTSTAAIIAPAVQMGPMIDNNTLPKGSPGLARPALETALANNTPTAMADRVGAFRTVCDYSHMNYVDPIVAPGRPGGSHLHAFFGNTMADASSTTESLLANGNSTCRGGTTNRSAYWVPALIDTRDGRAITPTRLTTYYKTGYGGVDPAQVKPFPYGLRMIAGSAGGSTPLSHWGLKYTCSGATTYTAYSNIPVCPAGTMVEMIIVFPQCWNGVDVDSADHKSHMAYPTGKGCPSTHPVPLPEVAYILQYLVNPTDDVRAWRLASDIYETTKPAGYSLHADWWNGWDPAVAKVWTEQCLNKGLDCHGGLLGDGRMLSGTYNEGTR